MKQYLFPSVSYLRVHAVAASRGAPKRPIRQAAVHADRPHVKIPRLRVVAVGDRTYAVGARADLVAYGFERVQKGVVREAELPPVAVRGSF